MSFEKSVCRIAAQCSGAETVPSDALFCAVAGTVQHESAIAPAVAIKAEDTRIAALLAVDCSGLPASPSSCALPSLLPSRFHIAGIEDRVFRLSNATHDGPARTPRSSLHARKLAPIT